MSSSASSTPGTTSGTPSGPSGRRHRAGAFDMRNFIAGLIGIYGIVLTIYGVVGSSATQLKKAGDVNINLWAGIVMILVSVVFIVWARLRPVVVPDHVETSDGPAAGH